MQSQTNVFDSITYGKIKRPPTTHVAQLSPMPWTGAAGPWIHAVNRDAADKYHVVIQNGMCQVFDGITGAQYGVLTPNGTAYLTPTPPAPVFVPQIDFDTFSGTLSSTLATHMADTGQTWVTIPGTAGFLGQPGIESFINAATLNGTSSPFMQWGVASSNKWSGYYFTEPLLTLADYSVSLDIYSTANVGVTTACSTILGLRVVDGTPITGYAVQIPAPWDTTTNWDIFRLDPGGATIIGGAPNPALFTWFPGATPTHTIKFGIKGSVITLLLDGVQIATVTDATYTSVGQPMIAGHDEGSPTTPRIKLNNFNLNFETTYTPPAPVEAGFRFTTVQDTTFIVNQSKVVEPLLSAYTPVRNPEALITIALADYASNYYVTLNGVTVGFQTPTPSSPQSRAPLSTDTMAAQLYASLSGSSLLTAFEFQLLGMIGTTEGASTIYVTRTDGADFTISANDGLNDQGIVVVKSTVQNIAALPARAAQNMVIKVQPDPQNNIDVAYYAYDNSGSPNLGGVWRESAASGILTTLDNTTMPWQLTRSGDLVSGYPADGAPPLPFITYGGPGSTTYPQPNTGSSGPPATPNLRGTLSNNGAGINLWFPTLAGTPTTMTWCYDVDFGSVPIGQYAIVTITDIAASTTNVNYFQGGTTAQNWQQSFVTSSPSNSEFSIQLNYSIGSGSAGSINIHGFVTDPLTSYPGVTFVIPTAVELLWNEDWVFAGGVPIIISITGAGGSPQTYTPASDETAFQVATGTAALTFTGYTGSVINGTQTQFLKGSGAPGTTTVAITWDPSKQYHNRNLQLAPGSLIGFIFNDLTDGSSATITANSATTITFSAGLVGGITNKANLNDIVSVTGSNNQVFFILQPINWVPRAAGDDITNPFPPFTYSTIAEVGFTSGRLCLFSGENIVCSGSDDVFDMFRTTVTQLLDADRISVQANSDTVSDWHSMVHWAEGVWLFAGNVQAQLPTQPSLSNSTVSIQPLTKYQSQPTLRPLAMDRRIYFARLRSPNSAAPVTEILRYQRIRFPFLGFIAEPATKAIPTYLAGTPLYLVGDPIVEIMVVLTDAVPNQMYPYIYHYSENQEIQMESWSTWAIDPGARILALDFLDGVMGLIVQRTDGVYLEYMDLQLAIYEAQS